jgi:hypothetical protein
MRIAHPVASTPEPRRAIRPPAAAGPMMRAVLNDAELSPTAFARSSVPTISTTNDCRAGASKAVPVPNRNART